MKGFIDLVFETEGQGTESRSKKGLKLPAASPAVPGGNDARALACVRRSRCRGAGKARRLSSKLPRQPSTLEVLHELDLLDEFLKLPHQKAYGLGVHIGNTTIPIADFSHLPTRCKFIAFIPQWDFLNFLVQQAAHYPAFDLRIRAEATDLIKESVRIAGLRAQTPNGLLEIRAGLVVAADGRSSILGEKRA